MANPCGGVHMPNSPCRECDRIRRAGDAQPEHAPVMTGSVEATGVSKRHDSSGASRGGDVTDDAPSKINRPDRLEVAKEALSAAERQRKFREKDPEAYRKWNRERMREFRKK